MGDIENHFHLIGGYIRYEKWLTVSTLALSLALVGCADQEEKSADKELKEETTQTQQETANTSEVEKRHFKMVSMRKLFKRL